MLMVTFLVTLSASLCAQQTGSVVGSVVDKTGAVIPKASVTLTNTASKDTRHTSSNAEGFFSFSGVVSGDYSVKAESKGFSVAEQSGIHISPGDRRNLDVSLAVATTDISVVVEASASAITVDSGDLASTLNSKQISDMALTGRDVTELIKTLPGFNQFTNGGGMQNQAGYDSTVTSIQSAVGDGITGAGAPNRAGGTNLTSDGANILDPGCNCNATQTVNADMVAEVKVTTSAYGADQNSGPVVIAAVGKSGSTEYHGAGYLHYRNAVLNSNNWINKWNGLSRPDDRYYYPGGQFGGPIPYTHKKLVGFGGFEYYNQQFPEQTSQGILQANVPTMSERQGLFDPTLPDNAAACAAMSTGVSGSYRCQQFTTIATGPSTTVNVVNEDIASYIAPGAQALMVLVPEPNRTPTSGTDYNYVKSLMNTNNGYMFHTRVDYDLSENTKLYVSYNQQHELYGQPIMRWWKAVDTVASPGGGASSAHSRTLSGNLVHVFNTETTNEFLANISYLYTPNTINNEKAIDKTATKYPYNYPNYSSILPSIYNTWYSGDFGVPFNYDLGRYAYFIHKVQPSISDNFTKVFKTHTLKAGLSWQGVWDNEANVGQSNGPNGTDGYSPVWGLPGNAFGMDPVVNFMTDLSSSYSVAPVTNNDDRSPYSMGYYVQDDWKTTRKLTLNLGIRLAHDTPYEDATGKWGGPVFTTAWYNADVAAGITDLPGMRWHGQDVAGNGVHTLSSLPLSGRTLNSVFWGPRFGMAYDLYGDGKSVVRGGLGVYYFKDGIGAFASTSEPQGGTSCTTTSAMFLSAISASTLPCATTLSGITSGAANDPNDHLEPHTLTYNFTVSQQIPGKVALEISYMGSQTSDLTNPLMGALNSQIPLGTYMKPDPNPASKYYGQVLALANSTTGDSNATVSNNLQDYVPFTHYSTLGLISHVNGAWANYNSLQAAFFKRQGSLTYNLNYTWSKTMGINTSSADPFNLKNDYGVLNQDRSHVLNATYAYEVGNRFKTKLVGGALNGWMLSGITGVQSGPDFPENFSMNMGFGGTDSLTNSTVTVGSTNTAITRNTINNTTFLGTPSYTLFPKLTCNPGMGLTKGEYINPKCFAVPALPTIDPNTGVLTALGSNGQSQMPYFHGPIYFDTDLSASRTIRVTERQNAQIKFSATNFLNHALTSFDQNNPNNLNLSLSNGVLTTQGGGLPNGGQWSYGVPNEKFGRRILEMSLRYNF
jgi:hypothetical protein